MNRVTTKTFVVAGIAVALLLAFLISPYASSSPDGLEKVAADQGIDTTMQDHTMADSPLANYSVQGVHDSKISTGLAGVAGVAATFAVGMGLFAIVRLGRRGRGSQSPLAP